MLAKMPAVQQKLGTSFGASRDKGSEVLHHLSAGLGGVSTVKSFTAEEVESLRIETLSRDASALTDSATGAGVGVAFTAQALVLSGFVASTAASGAMVAAATTSIPERLEGGRNYDYRYVWIRDQCYTGQAVAADGPHRLLDDAVDFVAERVLADGPELKPAYTVRRGPVPDERPLRTLAGYPGGAHSILRGPAGVSLCRAAAALFPIPAKSAFYLNFQGLCSRQPRSAARPHPRRRHAAGHPA